MKSSQNIFFSICWAVPYADRGKYIGSIYWCIFIDAFLSVCLDVQWMVRIFYRETRWPLFILDMVCFLCFQYNYRIPRSDGTVREFKASQWVKECTIYSMIQAPGAQWMPSPELPEESRIHEPELATGSAKSRHNSSQNISFKEIHILSSDYLWD